VGAAEVDQRSTQRRKDAKGAKIEMIFAPFVLWMWRYFSRLEQKTDLTQRRRGAEIEKISAPFCLCKNLNQLILVLDSVQRMNARTAEYSNHLNLCDLCPFAPLR
jgi:hypothetical protein